MKRILFFLSIFSIALLQSCSGPEGIPGRDGQDGQDGLLSEVFELRNINFGYNPSNGYRIYQTLNPKIYASDVILIYRLSGTIDPSTPIWQPIPRTLFISLGKELDYDFDFSKEDFTIYAGGTYDLSTTPQYILNQTFRIVIVPGAFSNKNAIDYNDYNAVIKAFNIDDRNVKKLN
jgi:hypothetical protein